MKTGMPVRGWYWNSMDLAKDKKMEEAQENKTAAGENPHIYKPSYKKEEVEELARWFEERMGQLPASLQLNSSTTSTNLPHTVKALLAVLVKHKENITTTFSGYMAHLELIRLRLREQGME